MRSNFKKPRVDSKALREGGRGLSCVIHPGKPVHSGAHLPWHSEGHGGRGIKAPDWLLADLCHECHIYADGDGRHDFEFRHRALIRTIERRFWQGLLVVPGQDNSAEYML